MIDLERLIDSVKSINAVDSGFAANLKLLDIVCNAYTYSDIPFDTISEDDILELATEKVDKHLDFVWMLREKVREIPRMVNSEAVDFI